MAAWLAPVLEARGGLDLSPLKAWTD